MNEELFLKNLRGEDKEHFAIVNGHGSIEVYNCNEYFETPTPKRKENDLSDVTYQSTPYKEFRTRRKKKRLVKAPNFKEHIAKRIICKQIIHI